MAKIRAIYLGDLRFDNCGVFELNEKTGNYEMLSCKDIRYPKECVEEDTDFIIVKVEQDHVKLTHRHSLER